MSEITHTHKSIVITYDENANLWRFTLRDRDRSADSLAKCKEAIDKQPAGKAKPFEKIKAWKMDRHSFGSPVEITGIAERRFGRQQVWINQDGRRSKEVAEFGIYPANEKNDRLMDEIKEKRAKIHGIEAEIDSLISTLDALILEIPE